MCDRIIRKTCILFIYALSFFDAFEGFAQHAGNTQINRVGYDQLQYIAAGDSVGNLQQAIDYFNAAKYIPSRHPGLNLGIAKDNYWVSFLVNNTGDEKKEFIVNLENPRLNTVDAYLVKQDSTAQKFRFGDNFPFHSRVLYQNFFAFPVTVPAGDSLRVFLFIKHMGNTLQVPILIMNNNSFLASIESNYIITGITTGVLFLTFFFALFFFFQAKTRLFFLYAVYVFLLCAWVWSTEGFAFQYLYPHIPDWATRLGPGISVLAVAAFMACCLQFCKPYDNKSLLHKILKLLMYLLTGWGIIPLLPFIDISKAADMKLFLATHFLLNIASILLLVAYLLWVAIKKNKLVWFYFAAVFLSMVCSFTIVARHSGLLDLPVTSATFMSMGIIIEIILMTAGITSQYYSYKKEKEAMLVAYLDQQKAITQKILMTEEAERKRIGRELHDDIGAGLTRIALMSDAAVNKSKPDTAMIEEIAATCRKLVGSMGEIVWSLNPENNSLEQLFAYMREELHKLLEYAGIEYSIRLPELTNPDSTLSNQQRRNLLLVTKEAVNNAVKYSGAGLITIDATITNNNLHFSVLDNGKGFDENTIRKGNGLRNMYQRMEELEGKISIRSIEKKGTKIEYSVQLE